MDKQLISIDYFPDGDMLSVTFGTIGRKGQGFELNDYIYIRVDPKTHEPLGLTLLSYSKLIKLNEIPLDYWYELAQEIQQILSSILLSYPVNLFMHLKKEAINVLPVSTFPDTSLKQLIAA